MNANKCLGRLYPHAAEVCIVLEVFSFQKLVGAELNLSTDFSTGEVEMFTKVSLQKSAATLRRPPRPIALPSHKRDRAQGADAIRPPDRSILLAP